MLIGTGSLVRRVDRNRKYVQIVLKPDPTDKTGRWFMVAPRNIVGTYLMAGYQPTFTHAMMLEVLDKETGIWHDPYREERERYFEEFPNV